MFGWVTHIGGIAHPKALIDLFDRKKIVYIPASIRALSGGHGSYARYCYDLFESEARTDGEHETRLLDPGSPGLTGTNG